MCPTRQPSAGIYYGAYCSLSLQGRRVWRQECSTIATTMQLLKNKLIELREQLESIAATGDESAAVVELDQSKVGRLSRMDAMQAQAMAQASGQRRISQLKEIEAALKRIDDGDYGICQDCDEPINPRRLEVDPTARLCIDCASKAE